MSSIDKGFRSSDRRQYSGSLLGDMGVTLLLIIAGTGYSVAGGPPTGYISLLTYLLTYFLLTYSMKKILLEKLTGFQLVKKFPAFHGTRMCFTAITSARHLSLSSIMFPYTIFTCLTSVMENLLRLSCCSRTPLLFIITFRGSTLRLLEC